MKICKLRPPIIKKAVWIRNFLDTSIALILKSVIYLGRLEIMEIAIGVSVIYW